MPLATWSGLGRRRQRTLGTAEQFCLLRVVRNLIDRLESAKQMSPMSLGFRRDGLVRHEGIAARILEVDTRARSCIESISFVAPDSDWNFAALEMVIGMAMPRLAGTPATRPAAHRATPRGGLPPLPEDVEIELWDKVHVERHLASLEWGMRTE